MFRGSKNLASHIETSHISEKPTFQCPLCPKAYYTSQRLSFHSNSHNEKSFPCRDCEENFTTELDLQSHIRIIHHGNDMKNMCMICPRSFKSKYSFKKHMEVVHGDQKKVQCTECGAWLKNYLTLKIHMKMHEEGAEAVCIECGKQTPNKRALQKHIKFMHKLKPIYNCDFCDKSFKLSILLREHMTMHTGEVLYTCQFCPRTFNSSANMHAHKKTRHPVEWAEEKHKKNFT